jgi:hypothetical protein
MTNPWFRFYSDALRDRKLERVCMITKMPKALVIGVWTTLLALANDSPVQGALLLTENIPLTFDDLCLETGLDAETLTVLLDQFIALGILHLTDSVYHITNWSKRQFKSDTSSDRVRSHRERKAKEEQDECDEETPEDDLDETPDDCEDETLQERFCNAPDTDTDTEADTETEKESEKTFLSANADYQVVRKRWIELFPGKPKPREVSRTLQGKAKTRMKSKDFVDQWESALERASRSSFLVKENWFDLGWFLANDENWYKCLSGKYDRQGPNGSAPAEKHPPEKKKRVGINPFTGAVEEFVA